MAKAISKNFLSNEFDCQCSPPCNTEFTVDSQLIKILQAIRDAIGQPLRVSSGVRCAVRNKATPGAAKRSFHVPRDGVLYAADIQLLDPTNRNIKTALAIYSLADQHDATGGLGLYSNRCHIDTRQRATKGQERARWIDKSVNLSTLYKA